MVKRDELPHPREAAPNKGETHENPDDDGRVERSGDCHLCRDQLRDERSGPGDSRLRPPRIPTGISRDSGTEKSETKIMNTLTTLFQWSAVAVALYAGAMFLMAGQTVALFG